MGGSANGTEVGGRSQYGVAIDKSLVPVDALKQSLCSNSQELSPTSHFVLVVYPPSHQRQSGSPSHSVARVERTSAVATPNPGIFLLMGL